VSRVGHLAHASTAQAETNFDERRFLSLGNVARIAARKRAEAGPCGYVVHRFLQRPKIDCVIIAPSLVSRKPGGRVKTDRRVKLTDSRPHGHVSAVLSMARALEFERIIDREPSRKRSFPR
jgi:transposase